MSSGRINMMLTGKQAKKKTEDESFKKSDEQMGKEAEELINQMSDAAQEDRDLYKAKKPALKKLLMAP